MTSTGVRDENSRDKRIIKGLILNEAQFIQSLRVFANTSSLSGLGAIGGDSNNSPLEASGNALFKSGDIMLGQLGNAFNTIAATNIVNGILDVSKTSGVTFPIVILQGESPPDADELVTIIQGEDVFPYQELVIRTRSSIITIKNSDNINTPDGNDLVLPVGSIIHLYFDTFLGEWVIDGGTPFFGGTGGGGISFPIDFPEDDRGPVGASTQEIVFSDSDRHSVKMELTGDVELAFSSPPTGETAYTNIIIVQDGVGGHTLTLPVGTVNKEIVEAGFLTGIDEETGIVIKFAFGVFYAFLETGNIVSGGAPAFSGNLSDLLIDVTKDWQSQGISNLGTITGVTGISATGSGVVISGIDTYDFFQGGQSIQNKADPDGGLLYNVNDLQSHIFRAGLTEIARFEEIAANVFRLNLLDHRIINAQDIAFDVAASFVGSGAVPTIGYDGGTDRLLINLPANGNLFITNNNAIGATQMNNSRVSTNNLTANDVLQLGVSLILPSFPGEFRSDGVDVQVFSGGALRNLSNIGVQNSIVDGNSSATILDAAPSFVVVLDGVQKYSISNTRVDFEELDLFGITQINMNDSLANPISTLTSSVTGLVLNIINTNNLYDIFIGGNSAFHIDKFRTRILPDSPNIDPAVFSLFRDDPSPNIDDELGLIKFDGRDSGGNFTTYGELRTTIENPTDGSEMSNFFIKLKQNNFDIDMFRLVNGAMVLRSFNSVSNEGASFILLKEDDSPGAGDLIARINYNILDSSTETIYAQTRAEIVSATDAGKYFISVRTDNNSSLVDAIEIIGDDNNLRSFMNVNARISSDLIFGVEIGGTDLKIFPAVNSMGIVVQDNVAFTVGTAGMLAIPQAVPNTIPTKAQLDVIYGNHKGAMGIDTGLVPHLFVRSSNGDWFRFNVDTVITA